jgi:hypothetical protein
MLNNFLLSDSESEDAEILIHGMFATQLPPLLSDIITRKSTTALIQELATKPKSTLFVRDSKSGYISRLASGVKSPEYIFGGNWAAESIKFFTLKVDESWRPMAIPNIKHTVMFAYNSLLVAESALNQIYTRAERISGRTSHSESPIIGRNGIFSAMLYDPFDDEADQQSQDEAIGFIGYEQTNQFFEESRLHKYRIESTYPYVFQIDLSKYFENIYTHLLANIDVQTFRLSSEHAKTSLGKYLKWLDEFNQKVNDNHTKGMIQGPVSSKVSAEIFQLSLDQKIEAELVNQHLDVSFTRYVDDYRFFARTITDLELVKTMLVKLFRSHELSFNETKVKLFKGFEIQKQAHFEKYQSIIPVLRRRRVSFTFKQYQRVHDSISEMIESSDIPTVKAVLTILKKKTQMNKIQFPNDQIILSFLEFLIKISYVLPIVCMQTYKVIYEIVNSVEPKTRHQCWRRLFDEFDFIRENYADSDLEIWYFYVLANSGTSSETLKVVSRYLKTNGSISPILLCVLTKPRSKASNAKIEAAIVSQVKDWQKISQSKWWLPLSQLWVSTQRKVSSNEIKKLFLSNNGSKIQWDKLGIVEYLMCHV